MEHGIIYPNGEPPALSEEEEAEKQRSYDRYSQGKAHRFMLAAIRGQEVYNGAVIKRPSVYVEEKWNNGS